MLTMLTMMSRFLVTVAFALVIGNVDVIGAVESDFSGTWILDKANSDPVQYRRGRKARSGADQTESNVTLVIKQSANELAVTKKITANGRERELQEKHALDGQENTTTALAGRGAVTSKTRWEGNKLVTEGSQKAAKKRGDMELRFKEERTLSQDGKALTIVTTRTTRKGDRAVKQVFNKQ